MKVLFFIVMVGVLAGCDNGLYSKSKTETPAKSEQSNNAPISTPEAVSTPEQPKQANFNITDKSIESNGNVAIAAEVLNTKTDQSWDGIKKTSAESISKSPYSAIGKLYSISGRVYKTEELPPSKGLNGQWSEILMLADNPNSALGVSTIDCICSGSADKIKSGRGATCSGYFVGTYESQNAMGGAVEGYVFIGYAKNYHR